MVTKCNKSSYTDCINNNLNPNEELCKWIPDDINNLTGKGKCTIKSCGELSSEICETNTNCINIKGLNDNNCILKPSLLQKNNNISTEKYYKELNNGKYILNPNMLDKDKERCNTNNSGKIKDYSTSFSELIDGSCNDKCSTYNINPDESGGDCNRTNDCVWDNLNSICINKKKEQEISNDKDGKAYIYSKCVPTYQDVKNSVATIKNIDNSTPTINELLDSCIYSKPPGDKSGLIFIDQLDYADAGKIKDTGITINDTNIDSKRKFKVSIVILIYFLLITYAGIDNMIGLKNIINFIIRKVLSLFGGGIQAGGADTEPSVADDSPIIEEGIESIFLNSEQKIIPWIVLVLYIFSSVVWIIWTLRLFNDNNPYKFKIGWVGLGIISLLSILIFTIKRFIPWFNNLREARREAAERAEEARQEEEARQQEEEARQAERNRRLLGIRRAREAARRRRDAPKIAAATTIQRAFRKRQEEARRRRREEEERLKKAIEEDSKKYKTLRDKRGKEPRPPRPPRPSPEELATEPRIMETMETDIDAAAAARGPKPVTPPDDDAAAARGPAEPAEPQLKTISEDDFNEWLETPMLQIQSPPVIYKSNISIISDQAGGAGLLKLFRQKPNNIYYYIFLTPDPETQQYKIKKYDFNDSKNKSVQEITLNNINNEKIRELGLQESEITESIINSIIETEKKATETATKEEARKAKRAEAKAIRKRQEKERAEKLEERRKSQAEERAKKAEERKRKRKEKRPKISKSQAEAAGQAGPAEPPTRAYNIHISGGQGGLDHTGLMIELKDVFVPPLVEGNFIPFKINNKFLDNSNLLGFLKFTDGDNGLVTSSAHWHCWVKRDNFMYVIDSVADVEKTDSRNQTHGTIIKFDLSNSDTKEKIIKYLNSSRPKGDVSYKGIDNIIALTYNINDGGNIIEYNVNSKKRVVDQIVLAELPRIEPAPLVRGARAPDPTKSQGVNVLITLYEIIGTDEDKINDIFTTFKRKPWAIDKIKELVKEGKAENSDSVTGQQFFNNLNSNELPEGELEDIIRYATETPSKASEPSQTTPKKSKSSQSPPKQSDTKKVTDDLRTIGDYEIVEQKSTNKDGIIMHDIQKSDYCGYHSVNNLLANVIPGFKIEACQQIGSLSYSQVLTYLTKLLCSQEIIFGNCGMVRRGGRRKRYKSFKKRKNKRNKTEKK